METIDEAEGSSQHGRRPPLGGGDQPNEIMAKLTIFSAVSCARLHRRLLGPELRGACQFKSFGVMSVLSLGLCAVVPIVLGTWLWWKRWL